MLAQGSFDLVFDPVSGQAAILRQSLGERLPGVHPGSHRAEDRSNLVELVLHVLHEHHELRLEAPRVRDQRHHGDALAVALDLHTSDDELLRVDMPINLEHLEDLLGIRELNLHRVHEVHDRRHLHGDAGLELVPGDEAGVGFGLAVQPVLHVVDLLVALELLHDVAFILLGNLHCGVNEHARQDVQHGNGREGDEEEEEAVDVPAARLQGLREGPPVVAAGDRHVQRDRGDDDGAPIRIDSLLDFRFDGFDVVEESAHRLQEDKPEEVHDERQHHDGPAEGRHRAHDGGEHHAQLPEESHHAHDAEHLGHLQQTQESKPRDIHGARHVGPLGDELVDREEHQAQIENVPPPLRVHDEAQGGERTHLEDELCAVERHEEVAHLLDEVGGLPLAFAGILQRIRHRQVGLHADHHGVERDHETRDGVEVRVGDELGAPALILLLLLLLFRA
mmetsp:Transcript_37733/g.112055  ORF Transcript_37733/g.112055 Transcript_37733/m.112055 type:complete len:449 (+) Transcript_37733:261-1607(+)